MSVPYDINEEKEELTNKLSLQYSRNVIDIEEYERIVEYINKVETSKEIGIIKKVIQENDLKNNDALILPQNDNAEKHLALFSWRSSNVVSLNGNGGSYLSLFGTNKIIIDNLPKGRTIIHVDSIFGLTEIVVSRNIKIVNKTVPVFSGIFIPDEINKENEDLPELYITGTAVFGNITIKRV
ncbi:hypothetical protein FACS189485_13580 [Spirochaetia bacterium]|nr:hypothetical protein FACS189485_13580 [Spirochaetia bacterium]